MIYSVIDVETTGFSPRKNDRILEIGIARLNEDGSIENVLDTLLNPERPVAATHVHGITDSMVAEAPLFRDIIPVIEGILSGSVIAAHNAAFDLGFLREEYRRNGMRMPFVKPACTLIMARRYLPALPSKSLESCRSHLGISDEGAHNALADAVSAARLLRHFLHHHNARPDAEPYRSVWSGEAQPGLFDMEPVLKSRKKLR